MKITFNNTDFTNFFNMISVYKTYVEIADKVEVEPPRSAIDLLIYKLASLTIENEWYQTTLENENMCFAIIQFMFGTAKLKIDEDVASAFNITGQILEIDIKQLWDYLVQNGIEI